MNLVFEVHSPVFSSKDDVKKWVNQKFREIVAEIEMFKRMGVVIDYVLFPLLQNGNKFLWNVRGVIKGGTGFSLGVSFEVNKFGENYLVLVKMGFSWVSPHSKTRQRLTSVKNLNTEFRSKKFWRAFSEKEGSRILVRWDNYPHHPDSGSWPFHKHFGGQKVPASPSQEQSVVGFFEFIKAHLGKS